MCGIAGLIGRSNNKDVSFQLLSRLLANCEDRGKDASGYWGTEVNNGKILYHKEPVKSSEFVKSDGWKKCAQYNFDLMICHARGTSTGVGGASVNKNNHPFTTADRSLGLIHNGRVPDSEYDVLKKQWEVETRCDSEILLRILESGANYDSEELNKVFPELDTRIAMRLIGIRDIWRYAHKAHMAVAIGERLESKNGRRLWLTRNHHRPIWLADMRSTIGQVFFASTPEIWQNSVLQTPAIRKYLNNNIKLIEVPTEEIWVMTIDEDNGIVEDDQLMKFTVQTSSGFKEWKPDEENKIPIPGGNPVAAVHTFLNEEGDVVKDVGKFPPSTNKTVQAATGNGGTTATSVTKPQHVSSSNGRNIVPITSNANDNNNNGNANGGSKVNYGPQPRIGGSYGAGARGHNTAAIQRGVVIGDDGTEEEDDGEIDFSTSGNYDTITSKHCAKKIMREIEEKITEIKKFLDDIDICVTNHGDYESQPEMYNNLHYDLERMAMELQGSLRILEGHRS